MRALVPIGCNQVATLLLGIVGLKLISEFVPPDLNGAYRLFLTLTQLGALITCSGLINHATRHWQQESAQSGTYARFLWVVAWRELRYLAPLLLILAFAVAFFQRDWNWLWAWPFLVLSNLALALSGIATGALNADRSLWKVFFLTLIGNAARVLLPIGLALGIGMTFLNLSAGFTLHGLLVVGCMLCLFRWAAGAPMPSAEKQTEWRQELKDYGRPFMWLGVGNWLLQSADPWVVEHFFGERETGFFTYASGIGAIIPTLVVGGLMQWVFPGVFRRADEAKTAQDWRALAKTCDQVTLLFLALALAGLFLLDLIAPRLIGPLIDPKYAPALAMLIPAGFAMVTVQVNQFYYLLLQGQHNSAGMVRVMLVVSGLKTLGSIVAAWFSWTAFAGWLIVSLLSSGLLGRWMIRRLALRMDRNE